MRELDRVDGPGGEQSAPHGLGPFSPTDSVECRKPLGEPSIKLLYQDLLHARSACAVESTESCFALEF